MATTRSPVSAGSREMSFDSFVASDASGKLPVRAILGTVVHTPVKGEMEIIEDALVLVDEAGIISSVVKPKDAGYEDKVDRASVLFGDGFVKLEPDSFLTPGLMDLHIHAPQWPMLGSGENLDLKHWLETHTFPTESKFSDTAYAVEVYEDMVQTLLSYGTTTAVYFGSIHTDACLALVDMCMKHGQRAFVGKTVMDCVKGCPDFYRETSSEALEGTKEFIEYVQAMAGVGDDALVQPIITPRFLPSCTDATLAGLGKLRESTGVRLQTHASESDWEVSYGAERFGKPDSAVFREFNLLGRGSIMAHGVFVTDDCLDVYKETGAGIAHCPLSNTLFSNAILPVRKLMDEGVSVGLGTDVGAGSSPSVLANARLAVSTARMLGDGVDPDKHHTKRGATPGRVDVSMEEALYLATLGGAVSLGLEDRLGSIEVGKTLDAVQWRAGRGTPVRTWSHDTLMNAITRMFYLADDRNVQRVWVDGKQVSGVPPAPTASTASTRSSTPL